MTDHGDLKSLRAIEEAITTQAPRGDVEPNLGVYELMRDVERLMRAADEVHKKLTNRMIEIAMHVNELDQKLSDTHERFCRGNGGERK